MFGIDVGMADISARQIPTHWIVIACAALLITLGVDHNAQKTQLSRSAIFSTSNAAQLVLGNDQRQIEFTRIDNQWHVLLPFAAPANPQVIEHMLASNHRSARSYSLTDIPQIASLPNVARLEIDQHVFEFKTIEPVSGLRYVVANDRIYLHPDRVVPLIQADVQMAANRKIADICGAQTTPCAAATLEASHLLALEADQIALGEIDIQLANGKTETYSLYNADDQVALHRQGTGYLYVLDPTTTAQLGLSPPNI